MTEPTRLEDYKKNKILTRNEKFLLRDIFNSYNKAYCIALRQLGKKEYLGRFIEDNFGENLFFELLTTNEKKDLELITLKLEGILDSIRVKLK